MIKICTPIVAATHKAAEASCKAATAAGADCVELRIDHLREPADIPRLLSASKPLPAILTCRAAREGGSWQGTEEERLAYLNDGIRLGVSYVDVEADALHRLNRSGESPTQIIASRHDFEETPENLCQWVEELEALPCDIIKFATFARDLRDNLKCFAALDKARKPAIGICMGELGEISRILGGRHDSFLTFATLDPSQSSAPGQFTLEDLVHLYRIKEIDKETPLYGVLGNPIAHSMSPEIHNSALKALNRKGVYLRFRVDDFECFLSDVAKPLGMAGLSVTIPHKESALAASKKVEPLAKAIGSVNTLTRIPGGWHGDNTDCEAAVGAIRKAAQKADLPLADASTVVLGAGGTARALAFGLKDAGCRVTLANRTRSRAEALAGEVEVAVMDLDQVANHPWQIIANTTSVGMHPKIEYSPLPDNIFKPGMVVFDAVYNPLETRLLKEAKAGGAGIASGFDMFVGQAAGQFERWTGEKAPLSIMGEVLYRRLRQHAEA